MKMLHEDQWRIYQDKDNAWFWKKTSYAGQILKSSVKSYQTRSECLENARNNGYRGN